MGIDFSSSAYSNRQNNWILDKLKDNDFIRKMVDKYSYLILRKYKDPNNFEYIINQLIPDAKISGTRNMWYKGNIIKWYEQNYLSTLETKR